MTKFDLGIVGLVGFIFVAKLAIDDYNQRETQKSQKVLAQKAMVKEVEREYPNFTARVQQENKRSSQARARVQSFYKKGVKKSRDTKSKQVKRVSGAIAKKNLQKRLGSYERVGNAIDWCTVDKTKDYMKYMSPPDSNSTYQTAMYKQYAVEINRISPLVREALEQPIKSYTFQEAEKSKCINYRLKHGLDTGFCD